MNNQPKNPEFEIIPSYIGWSFLSLLFCLPLGFIAVVFSAMTIQAKNNGNAGLAYRRSSSAKQWMIWTYAIGAIVGFSRIFNEVALK